jgi:Zn finger protein HypA/HybF involved in hydrogenase expression
MTAPALTQPAKETSMSTSVTAQCVSCKHKETLTPIPSDVPMCPKCYSPMVAVSAQKTTA